MRCPRCETSELDEREREGVTIDVCRACRGIWLDRGELEKLITREREFDGEIDRGRRDRDSDSGEQRRAQGLRRDGDRDSDDDVRYGKQRRRKSWLDTLGDIFD